jgi:eukaryotic-like serine/threonine-protein kinase
LYRKSTNGIKDEELLLKSDELKIPSSISPDGRYLLYTLVTSKTKADVWILTLDGSHKSMPVQVSEFNEAEAKFSPDGRWIAYQSDESGRPEVYVREFTLGSDGKPEATQSNPISNGGGINPYWRDGGKAVIYGSLDAKTGMLAEVTSFKPVFHSSPAKALGKLPLGADPVDITPDGKRVLAKVPVGQSGPQQFTVVQNWQVGLRK